MTRFNTASLVLLKQFINLPQDIYLHPSEEHPRPPHQQHQGCHHIIDEELILFSLHRFTHGLSITVMVNRFGGSIDKWMYGFQYFCSHLHPLIYPVIIGFNGYLSYIEQFPVCAAAVEESASEKRIRANGECDANIYPGIALAPN